MNRFCPNFRAVRRLCLTFLTACSALLQLGAQDSKGTEFWICVPGNNSSPVPQLFITSEADATVTVSIPGLAFNQVVNVPANSLQSVNLPTGAQIQSEFVTENKGIRITATTEVTVYLMNAQSASTDAYLAFPLDAVGTQYYVLGYNRDFSFSQPTQATVVATENNTTVTITATVTGGGFTAGVPRNIVLQQGQTYQLRSLATNADYSGSKITSDKPVAVFGGAQCTNISGNLRACDHLVEQLPPLSSWGRSFVTVPLATRTAGDVFRFLAQENGTEVSLNGVVIANLNAGQLHERILNSTSFNRVTANKPILVGQYSRSSDADGVTSDPFFSLVPPDEQFLNNYIISAGTPNIPNNFLNITSPTANTATVRVDNVVVNPALWTVIPGTNFSGARVPVTNGIHRVTSTLPIGLLVYGFGSFDSYGYLGGQSFSAVATVTTVDLTPETGSGPVGVSQCFNALVRDQFGNGVSGIRVDFAVSGANTTAGFAFTNSSGNAQFCYTGGNAGADNIVASVGSVSDNSTFTWQAVSAGPVYYSKPTGDLHNVLTWGLNPDGSGANPTDFGDSTFQLANRGSGLYTMTADWTVGGIINIPSGAQLQINGNLLSLTNLEGTGTISGSATSNLSVIGTDGGVVALNFTPASNMLNNFTVNRTGAGAAAALGNGLSVMNVLTIANGNLNTGGFLTLKSTAANTARVAPVNGAIMGDVTVERYIPSRRAWRILSAPVGGSGSGAANGQASMTHSQETVRGVLVNTDGTLRPLSYGTAVFALNSARTAMTMTATVFNIDVTGSQTPDANDNLVAAHIHVGAPLGANAPVRWGFFGAPDNDNNPDNLVVTPFGSGVGGTITSTWNELEGNAGTTLASNLPAIFAGLAYVNFHTTQFPGGEIRGQISLLAASTQTINQAWQEGAVLGLSPNPNPVPGYGTHITGGPIYGSTANGFDQNPGAQSSIKQYNALVNNWEVLQNTNDTRVGSDAYMTFIRGDRGIPIGLNTVPPSSTTLRAKGPLRVGDQVFQVSPNGFTAIPNPFASPINFATLTRTNTQNNFYVWDPKLGGANGVGAYVLLSFNGSTYDVSPAPVSPMSQFIQSGQGFLVRPETVGTPGSVTIKESDKSATAAQDVFRVAGGASRLFADPAKGEGLRISLMTLESDGSNAQLDEVFTSYQNGYAAKIDRMDAVKMPNEEENLGLVREGQTLMIERKPLPKDGDVMALKLWNTKPKTYVLELNPVNLAASGLTAYVEDRFLKTTTAVELNKVSQLFFTITADPASAKADRFQVVLARRAPDAVTAATGKSFIAAYPNPIVGQRIQLSFVNKDEGVYQVRLFNSVGQLVLQKAVTHAGGTAMRSLDVETKLKEGVYRLQIIYRSDITNLSISSH